MSSPTPSGPTDALTSDFQAYAQQLGVIQGDAAQVTIDQTSVASAQSALTAAQGTLGTDSSTLTASQAAMVPILNSIIADAQAKLAAIQPPAPPASS